MSFKGRTLTQMSSSFYAADGTTLWATNTDSIIRIYSLVSDLEVEFKAFLTDLTDDFQSSWNSEEVFGRMDPIGTFSGTKRTISVGWDVPAASLQEAISNAEALRTLTSMLYPGYSGNPVSVDDQAVVSANSISRSPLVRVKFANLIAAANGEGDSAKEGGLLGWIDGVNLQPQIEQGFLIDVNPATKEAKHYPKTYKLSIKLNVLHEHELGFDDQNGWSATGTSTKWPFGG